LAEQIVKLRQLRFGAAAVFFVRQKGPRHPGAGLFS